jgi:acetoin utilization deacetylase AcuC-like enzyme
MAAVAAELGVPVVICLEGGYALDALAGSVVATLEAMESADGVPEVPRDPAQPYLARLARHWPGL